MAKMKISKEIIELSEKIINISKLVITLLSEDYFDTLDYMRSLI